MHISLRKNIEYDRITDSDQVCVAVRSGEIELTSTCTRVEIIEARGFRDVSEAV